MKSDFKSQILKEIEDWQKEGLISAEQEKNLTSRYSLPEIASEKSALAKIITFLSIFGSILVGIGVILFFASNWRGISKPVKLLLILSSIFAAYSIGYTLSYIRETYSKTGKAIILLGSILFGSGIYLVAQIYHFPANYPAGVLFWSLGILPLAYILRLNPILFLSSILLILWNILRLTGLDQPNYFYLIFLGLIFYLTYKAKSSRIIFTNLVGFIIWLMSYLYFWNRGFDTHASVVVLLNLGILFYILGRVHETNLNLGRLKYSYKFLGIALMFFNTYLLTYDNVYEAHYSILGREFPGIMVVNFAIVSLTFTVLAVFSFKNWGKNKIVRYESCALLIVILLSMTTLIFPEASMRHNHYRSEEFLFYPFIFNLVLLLEIIGVIVLGYLFKEISLVNLGILFFVIQILTLYFSVFWKLMPRSLFFICGGLILLLGGGYLEKKRKDIIIKIKSGEAS
ncbi:MAG: DUF2157 domain-containing protein [Candidatus Omnitrophica bacterium]|nr:DUF2157 domain-containing protein [Candidatus Omnitrophota bacterium]MDD5311052.1 DUF2157 domain-containing protein [Candidatus Omnitrophota bacterium]MDD5546487.1 DUF2157 domain-containing protein [Candidatus Omnitrophota bacterium]